MKKLVADAGRDDIKVESAALHTDEIGSDIHRGTRAKLQEMGIPFAPRAAWLLTAAKAKVITVIPGSPACAEPVEVDGEVVGKAPVRLEVLDSQINVVVGF